ncbi:MAG: helix-turn-helix domain-containing protein [Gemmatimonas sp.]|nr:helix-turn-helix domain-containing protein [Gemmatimonas sp.]
MKKISTAELERRFDAGEDVDEYFDLSKAWRPGIAALAQEARAATGLSQAKFAERYRIPLRTFQDWEQGKRRASPAACNYLRAIAKLPDQIAEAIGDQERVA